MNRIKNYIKKKPYLFQLAKIALIFFNKINQVISSIYIHFRLKKSVSSSFPDLSLAKLIIVGSGPSIDLIDLQSISNANIILLNNSVRLSERFNSSNSVYWLVQDMSFFASIDPSQYNNINSIIIMDRYICSACSLRYLIKKSDAKKYLYIPLKINLLMLFAAKILPLKQVVNGAIRSTRSMNRYGFYVNPYRRLRKKDFLFSKSNDIWLGPWTVMLTAIVFSVRCGARQIFTLGFDGATSNKAYATAFENENIPQAYIKNSIEGTKYMNSTVLWTRHVYRNISGLGCTWLNVSPLSKNEAVPKCDPKILYEIQK